MRKNCQEKSIVSSCSFCPVLCGEKIPKYTPYVPPYYMHLKNNYLKTSEVKINKNA